MDGRDQDPPAPSAPPKSYKVVSICLYHADRLLLADIVAECKAAGITDASKSAVVRALLWGTPRAQVVEAMRLTTQGVKNVLVGKKGEDPGRKT